QHAVDEFGDARPQRLDGPRRERLGHQLAQPGVVRRVPVQHGHFLDGPGGVRTERRLPQLPERAVGQVAVPSRQARGPQQPEHLRVAGEQPEPQRVLIHGRGGTDRCVLRVRVVGETGRERVEQRFGLLGRGSLGLGHRGTPAIRIDCHILCVCHYTLRMQPVQSRREMYSEATRAALLEEATALFAARGYAGTSLEDVASASRVTRGAVYHHFASKQALFEAVLDMQEERAMAVVVTAAAASDPWEAAMLALDAFLDQCCDPTYGRLVWLEG